MFFKLMTILYFGFLFNLHADEEKRCLLDLCDGDTIRDVRNKGYTTHYRGNLMWSKKRKYKSYDSEVFAYFKSKDNALCDKTICIFFKEWIKDDLLKLIKSIVPEIRFLKPFPSEEPKGEKFFYVNQWGRKIGIVKKEVIFDVSFGKIKNFVKYARRGDARQIRISLGPTCVMVDDSNYFLSNEGIPFWNNSWD